MEWDENCEHGIEWQDNQHKELLEKINILLESVAIGKEDKEEFRQILIFISGYIKDHLTEEEYYMKKHGYPRLDNHIKEHQKFTEDFNIILSVFKYEGIESSVELLNKLTTWFFNHTQTTDKLLAKFLKKYETS